MTYSLPDDYMPYPLPNYIRKNRDEIAGLSRDEKSDDQISPYIIKNWHECKNKKKCKKCFSFKEDKDFEAIIKACSKSKEISRKDIFARKNNLGPDPSSSDLRKFFMAIMLWGYGTDGRGAWRTHQMVNSSNFPKTIEDSFKAIQDCNIEKAYEYFINNKIEQCGSAYFTKYLYFSGYDINKNPNPLILDTFVAIGLEEKCGIGIKKYASVSRHTKNTSNKKYKAKLAGKIESVEKSSSKYLCYLRDMNGWAKKLGVQPDQIEVFLWKKGKDCR